jgi:hypothetical protein
MRLCGELDTFQWHHPNILTISRLDEIGFTLIMATRHRHHLGANLLLEFHYEELWPLKPHYLATKTLKIIHLQLLCNNPLVLQLLCNYPPRNMVC